MDNFGLTRRIKPGYRALLHGPPGTGKTLTVGLLGQDTGLDVYRIDLAMVVSKYIGETEKNLGRIFDRAAGKNWILFFDEAESLFSKRTAVNDARDRYANQQVAYLLQRIEEYDGIVILASNLREHIDDAFTRRFDSIIYFPMPDTKARTRLWKQSVPPYVVWEKDIDLEVLAEERLLSGAAIMNVVRYASLMSEEAGHNELKRVHVMRGIQRELQKEGRSA
jgi:SpoVK/Ycf46/Vps4 family AAA+-type ATPase